ncbi:hypothetical protein ACCO45_006002 [Purpureocillium lilacinum]|uniref:Uncharacterized protein n=1 Tax=Purpureocillium lilacinum TaxID=33203 RepID=A0ACC4DWZ8_PURLI
MIRLLLLAVLCAGTLAHDHCGDPTTTAPPQYTVPCVVGNNKPCPKSWTCTPTETCHPHHRCGGLCINPPPTLPPVIPCTVGNNAPCPSGEHLHADHVLDAGPTRRRAVHRDADDHVADRAAVPDPPCTMGNSAPCSGGSTCTPTMVCTSGKPCGGACVSFPTPPPLTPVHHGEQRAVLDGEHLHAYDGVYPGDAVRRSVYSDGYVGCLFAGDLGRQGGAGYSCGCQAAVM